MEMAQSRGFGINVIWRHMYALKMPVLKYVKPEISQMFQIKLSAARTIVALYTKISKNL